MESLKISNFLLIKDVDIPIKKYNLVIGPQAIGKSVVAKVLYFFYQIPTLIENNVYNSGTYKDIQENLKDNFKALFPATYWSYKLFEITYKLDDLIIKIYNKEDHRNSIFIDFSKSYNNELEKIIGISALFSLELQSRVRDLKNDSQNDLKFHIDSNLLKRKIFSEAIEKSIFKSFFEKKHPEFVPASRALYSILSDKPVTFSSGIEIDSLFNKFAISYERYKDLYQYCAVDNPKNSREQIINQVHKFSEKILKGKYLYKDKKDWLSINNQRISVKNISSGQQEILPLLVMLTFGVFLASNSGKLGSYFIEEPEAHLFPEAQSEIMSLLSFLGYHFSSQFFITTHSPYLLSVFNNFIYGNELIKQGKTTLEEFNKISNNACPIDYDDIYAFSIIDGKSVSIMDKEYKFLDSKILDSASNAAEDVFNQLMALE